MSDALLFREREVEELEEWPDRAFEEIDIEFEELDRDAMRGRASHERSLAQLVDVRGEIGHLRRTLVAHRRVLLALTRPELGGISTAESGERFQSLLDRLAEVTQAARDSRESVVGRSTSS